MVRSLASWYPYTRTRFVLTMTHNIIQVIWLRLTGSLPTLQKFIRPCNPHTTSQISNGSLQIILTDLRLLKLIFWCSYHILHFKQACCQGEARGHTATPLKTFLTPNKIFENKNCALSHPFSCFSGYIPHDFRKSLASCSLFG